MTKLICTFFFLNVYVFISCYSQEMFSHEHIIDSLENGFIHVHSGDFDNDKNTDIVAVCFGKIFWYRNLGGGFFSSRISIESDAADCQCVYVADLDSDHDFDILADFGSGDTIVWYQNLGSGNFSLKKLITNSVKNPHCVYSIDLDNDGDNDVLSASVIDKKIAWYRNNGSGIFSAENVISKTINGASTVYSADIDGDTDMDVIAGGAWDNSLSWFQNIDGLGSFGPQKLITSNAIGIQFAYAADLDGDMDMDVYSASMGNGKFAWYENDGAGNFIKEHLINYATSATDICAHDFDNDGDIDIVTTSEGSALSWYENIGLGVFSSQKDISLSKNRSVWVADLNNDSKVDIISASCSQNKLSWYENKGYVNINEHAKKRISLYPNPVSDILTIQTNELIIVEIFDINGQLLFSGNKHELNLSALESGVYIIKIKSDNYCFTERIVKK